MNKIINIAARIASNKTIFYVDLDETLVSHTFDPDVESTEIMGIGFILRPGALDFLKSLRSMGDVALCTSSTRDYATAVCDEFGISSYLNKGIISREDLKSQIDNSNYENVILIDNLDINNEDIKQKLKTIGVLNIRKYPEPNLDDDDFDLGEYIRKQREYEIKAQKELAAKDLTRNFVKVKGFDGNSSDNELSHALSKVKSLLQS